MESKKQALLEELKEKFEEEKKRLEFKASYEDLEKAFFIEDAVLQAGFVSNRFSRQLSHKITDLLGSCNNYLHSLLMPNPSHMVNMTEAKSLSEEEKKKASKLISDSMAIISKNTLVGLTKVQKEESEFIDSALEFWNEKYKPAMIEFMTKIKENWEDLSKKEPEKEEKKERIGFD